MSRPSNARWLAPVALVVALLAVLVIGISSTSGGGGGPTPAGDDARPTARTPSTPTRTSPAPRSRSYRVEVGDSLGLIAEKTGASVEQIQELNPDLDPNALRVGQRIRLPPE